MSDWASVQRVVNSIQAQLTTATTVEDFQSIGLLGREALISTAQTVYVRERHHPQDGKELSSTDAKGMLDSFLAVELAGPANEEARRFAKAAVSLANAVTHDRVATRKDAQLVAVALEAVVGVIRVLEDESTFPREPWEGIEWEGRFFAWSGPGFHALPDRPGVPSPRPIEDGVRALGWIPSYGMLSRMNDHLAQGSHQVFETDRRTWRKALLYAGDGRQVLLVKKNTAPKGKPRILYPGWEGLNAQGKVYEPYPAVRYHPTLPERTVYSEAESDALGDEWADTPAAFPKKD